MTGVCVAFSIKVKSIALEKLGNGIRERGPRPHGGRWEHSARLRGDRLRRKPDERGAGRRPSPPDGALVKGKRFVRFPGRSDERAGAPERFTRDRGCVGEGVVRRRLEIRCWSEREGQHRPAEGAGEAVHDEEQALTGAHPGLDATRALVRCDVVVGPQQGERGRGARAE